MPSGMKFETSVGRPMPRLTCMPSRSSFATRMAMSSLTKPARVMPHPLDDSMHVDARRHDQLRIELACLDDLLCLGDGDRGSRRHYLVEVARRFTVDQVAGSVRF